MKNLIYLFILILCPLFGNAQDEEMTETKEPANTFNEIGINGTFVISQFLKLSDEEIPQSPYLLTYKLGVNRSAMRIGLGATFKESEKSVETFDDTETIKNSDFNFRLGYEYRSQLGNRWLGYFGADAIYFSAANEQINDSGFDIVTIAENTSGLGAGPVIGLNFFINEKLLIGTEGAFYFASSETKSTTTFKNFPEFDSDAEITNDKEIKTFLPSTIYIVFHF